MLNKVFSLQSSVIRQILVVLFLSLIFLYSIPCTLPPIFADNEFSASYNINYDVDASGVTTVTEKISLKNLTDRFYASSFNLSIGATQITDVAATDSQGPLEISAQNQGKKTAMTVKFGQQVAGTGKEYPFTIKFKSTDFAQQQGRIWQVSIPKISSPSNLDKYELSLSVPEAFGDPTSILPEPVKQSETAGKINYFFTKEQLSDSGILANFGDHQIFNFTLNYYMENGGLLPVLKEIVLPSDSAYQRIFLNDIEPKPENTFFDADGNTIAQFKLDKGQKINISATGIAQLTISQSKKEVLSANVLQQLTSSQKYWEKDSPQIAAKLSEIFNKQNPKTTQEKAKLIYKYVVATLSYDQDRVKKNDFQRLGALTALNNPTQALCLEFSDLFVTLMRAAGIPSEQLTGYAYSANTDIRPLSLNNNILHAWAQYYDPNVGWVMVDPTWENTTGGVDYFSRFDLNHLVLAIRGQHSEQPNPPSDVRVEFGQIDATPSSNIKVQLLSPDELFAGFPSKIKVMIENNGNSATSSAQFAIHAQQLDLVSDLRGVGNSFNTTALPPFGKLGYDFEAKSQSPLKGFDDNIEASFGDIQTSKKVVVKPFFAFNLFSFGILGVIALIIGFYLFTVIFHLKFHHHFQPAVAKKKS